MSKLGSRSRRPLFTIGKSGRLLKPRGHVSIIGAIESIVSIAPRVARDDEPCLMVPAWHHLTLALPAVDEAVTIEDDVRITVFWAHHGALKVNVLVVFDRRRDRGPRNNSQQYMILLEEHDVNDAIPSAVTMTVALVPNAATAHALAQFGRLSVRWQWMQGGGWATSVVPKPSIWAVRRAWRHVLMSTAFPHQRLMHVISPTHWSASMTGNSNGATLLCMTGINRDEIQAQFGIGRAEDALLEAIGFTPEGIILLVQIAQEEHSDIRVYVKLLTWDKMPRDFFTP